METPGEPRLVRRVADLPDETWADVPGGTSWRTLFDREVTGTGDLSVGLATVPPGGTWPPHRHPVAECYLVVDGEGRVQVGDEHHHATTGTAVMVPPGELHGVVNTGPAPLRFLYVFPVASLSDVTYDFG